MIDEIHCCSCQNFELCKVYILFGSHHFIFIPSRFGDLKPLDLVRISNGFVVPLVGFMASAYSLQIPEGLDLLISSLSET